MQRHIKYCVLFFAGLIILLLTGCNSEIKEIVPDTELKITVLDAQKNPIPGAVVGVFTSEKAYKDANAAFSLDGAIQIDTADADGLVEFYFQNVDKEPYYWLAGYIKDSATYTNATIMHDNDVSGYRILRPLNLASVTYGTITLTPAEALVSFYANDATPAALPLRIRVGNDTLTRLTTGTASISQHFAPQATTVKLRRGIYPYQIINKDGCAYMSQLEVKGGERNLFIQSNVCTLGRVQFFTGVTNASVLPITITLDVNNTIGNVDSTYAGGTPSCGSARTLTYFLEPGTYTYVARSSRTNCVWTGTFEVRQNECTQIELSRCF